MAGPDLESLYQAAMADHRAGRLDVAVAIYQQVLDQDPLFARTWHLLGVALHQQGDTALAIKYVQRAIGLEPQRAVFYSNLGSIYLSISRSREAEPALRRAIELSPASSAALVMLGNVLSEQNRCDEAVPVFSGRLRRIRATLKHSAVWAWPTASSDRSKAASPPTRRRMRFRASRSFAFSRRPNCRSFMNQRPTSRAGGSG